MYKCTHIVQTCVIQGSVAIYKTFMTSYHLAVISSGQELGDSQDRRLMYSAVHEVVALV